MCGGRRPCCGRKRTHSRREIETTQSKCTDSYRSRRNEEARARSEREKAMEKRLEEWEEHEADLKEALGMGQR